MSEFFHTTHNTMFQVDEEGKYWGSLSGFYKYKYLDENNEVRRSNWTTTKPRDFVRERNCSIIDYQTKERREG